ncbi:type II toxin-antitoxin system Phd/YefM family antitoxin [Rothia nasimurium]|uniref:type II toxin-antitoxin system Phd/YefM family antitoxin n=1 Tax=Rothia nasimurium TaxID=85336 RepID=UPI001F2D25DB|nr:type II toxin-antitoxin system Phd/YefM family antitoxin [Rothia nasimurium]
MTVVTTQFASSDLSRSAAKVFAAATEEPVRITRRDGENLVLMTEGELNRQQALLAVAAQIVAVSVFTTEDSELVSEMTKHFPWMLALKKTDQVQCAHDIIDDARASFSLRQPDLIMGTINAWKDTAEALAAGYRSGRYTVVENAVPLGRP